LRVSNYPIAPNHGLQARPGFALPFVLAPPPGLPEAKRCPNLSDAKVS
jgi:hypothetical protein